MNINDSEKERRAAELAAEKAEVWQQVTALYIPLSLFIACVIFSGGVFLVWHNEPVGWAFIATTVAIAISAFYALLKFQNKYRARGITAGVDTEMVGPNTGKIGPTTENKSEDKETQENTASV